MFIYCLNNPINRVDTLGSTSIWFYLILDHDMGFIHRLVQSHITAMYGTRYSTEMPLSGFGRADIVDTKIGHVWEVKHAGQFPEVRATIAAAQATTYIGGTNGNTIITGLGAANAFSGYFYIQCINEYYQVTYQTPQKGVVLYSVKQVENYNKNPYAVYVPQEQTNNNKGTLALGVVGFAGAGRSFHFYEDIIRDVACVY